jgi:hypothetical protein
VPSGSILCRGRRRSDSFTGECSGRRPRSPDPARAPHALHIAGCWPPATTAVASASPASPPTALQATAAARRSRQLHRGPHGDRGDRPVGPSGRPVGQAARARATQQRAIGLPLRPLTRAARDSRARSPPPPCLLLLPSRFALRTSAATVTVACLH